jgi:hypothetical protein
MVFFKQKITSSLSLSSLLIKLDIQFDELATGENFCSKVQNKIILTTLYKVGHHYFDLAIDVNP